MENSDFFMVLTPCGSPHPSPLVGSCSPSLPSPEGVGPTENSDFFRWPDSQRVHPFGPMSHPSPEGVQANGKF